MEVDVRTDRICAVDQTLTRPVRVWLRETTGTYDSSRVARLSHDAVDSLEVWHYVSS